MLDGFLPRTSRIDRVERQGDYDELAGDLMGWLVIEIIAGCNF